GGIRRQIQDRILKYKGLDDHLRGQERSDPNFGIDPGPLNNITSGKYRGSFNADMINVNRYREKCNCQPPDFNLLSSFLLEIGNQLGSVAIHVNESGYDEDECEQKYRGDSRGY